MIHRYRYMVSHLEVVRQLCAPGVSGVHGNGDHMHTHMHIHIFLYMCMIHRYRYMVSRLEVVRQLCAAGVPRVHGDIPLDIHTEMNMQIVCIVCILSAYV